MTENQQGPFDPATLFQSWMKAAADYWGETAGSWLASSQGGQAPDFPGAGFTGLAQEHLQSFSALYQPMFRLLSESETMASMMRGMNVLPPIGLKMADTWWKGFFTLQQMYLEKVAGMSARTESYKYGEINKETFKAWTQLYEQEIRRFFHLPPLGLARAYQERANRMMDAFNLFQAALSEFLYLTYLPMEKSLGAMQPELAARSEKDLSADDFREFYRKWVSALEGHYMTLLKSPEYIEAMNKAIEAYAGFAAARSKWMEDYLKKLPVPTQSEMDEVCRELHLLKKEIKFLRKSVKAK